MAVVFRGNVTWEQTEDTVWSVDNWGTDTASIVFRGSRLLKTAFEDSLQRWTALSGYPHMRLSRWSGQGYTPSFPGLALQYIGFRSGRIPPVKKTNGVSTQSAQGEGVDTASGDTVTGSFLYQAARTSYVWFETEKPATLPRYNTVEDTSDPRTRIIRYQIQNKNTGENLNNVPYSSFVAIFNSLFPRETVANYDSEELVPGSLWGCRADIDYRLT